MSEFPERIRNHWFVAGRSDRIHGTPKRVLLFGAPVVLVRDRSGVVLAMEDRCPHRGAPLSAGRLGSEGLVCPYHGWTFGAEGRCTAMPGAADSKPIVDVRVPSLRVVERDGLVWVADAATNPLPQRILAVDPAQRRFLWQTRWAAPILEAQENFLDALHTHTVHPGLVRRAHARRPTGVALQVGGDGFHVDYSGPPDQSGLLFRLFESRRTRERAYFSALSVAQLEYRYASGWAMWITLCFTPETHRSTHVFATLHVEGRWAPAWLVRTLVWPFLRQVARQDRRMLELQESGREHFPNRRPAVTPLDVVRPYLEEAWSGNASVLPPNRELTLYL
jgi:phenylpropionate dioxygenase-like ring-hydroxylating dioxygenase large terminal subunit